MEGEGMIDPGMEYLPPPSGGLAARKKLCVASSRIKCEAESEDEEGRQREDTFEEAVGQSLPVSTGAAGGPERRRMAHAEKERQAGAVCRAASMTLLSLYEEKVLLSRLDACPLALAVTPQAKRLHRKLRLRQTKRQRGLPLLDVDRAISATLSLVGGIYTAHGAGDAQRRIMGKYCTSSKEPRILDRFQVPRLFPIPHFLFVHQWAAHFHFAPTLQINNPEKEWTNHSCYSVDQSEHFSRSGPILLFLP